MKKTLLSGLYVAIAITAFDYFIRGVFSLHDAAIAFVLSVFFMILFKVASRAYRFIRKIAYMFGFAAALLIITAVSVAIIGFISDIISS